MCASREFVLHSLVILIMWRARKMKASDKKLYMCMHGVGKDGH